MAGKSNKGRNRRGSNNAATNSSESVVSSNASNKESKDNLSASEPIKDDANGVPVAVESTDTQPEVKEVEPENSASQTKQGKINNRENRRKDTRKNGSGILRSNF